jgi:hypothetical protein
MPQTRAQDSQTRVLFAQGLFVFVCTEFIKRSMMRPRLESSVCDCARQEGKVACVFGVCEKGCEMRRGFCKTNALL